MRLRATTKIRNDKMIAAREVMGLSQIELAKVVGVPLNHVCDLERLDFRSQAVIASAQDVAAILGIEVCDVCPQELIGLQLPCKNVQVRTMSTEMILSQTDRPRALEYHDPTSEIDAKELAKVALKRLSFREKQIITMIYGLNNTPALTQREIGQVFGITAARVGGICKNAIRKLKHPSIAHRLAGDNDAWAEWNKMAVDQKK